jgi:hypothetical protein
MLMLALLVLLVAAPRLLGSVSGVLADIGEARAMALLYRDLAALSDRELAARGLKREDIPRAVLATIHRRLIVG